MPPHDRPRILLPFLSRAGMRESVTALCIAVVAPGRGAILPVPRPVVVIGGPEPGKRPLHRLAKS